MTNDQSFIAKAKAQILELQRRRAVKQRHQREEDQELATQANLFLDTAEAEGLDPRHNPAHLAIVIRAWHLKMGEELPDDDTEQMTADHRDLNF